MSTPARQVKESLELFPAPIGISHLAARRSKAIAIGTVSRHATIIQASRPRGWRRTSLALARAVALLGLAAPPLAWTHGELDIRLAATSQAIAAATNDAALYIVRGELHREHKDWLAAAADYDTAERLNPKLVQLDFLRGRMLADADRLDEAGAMLDRHLARQTKDGLAYIERARVLARQNLHTNAVADFSRGLQLVSEPQPEFYIERAQAWLGAQRDAEALGSLDEGIKRIGPVITLQTLALELELKRKNYDAALARLETIIAQAARQERWLTQRGEIQIQANRPAEARRSFELALAAIYKVPARLQTLPPMMDLKSRIQSLQAKVAIPPAEPAAAAK